MQATRRRLQQRRRYQQRFCATSSTAAANGNVLNDGDSVTVIKDLKIKGSSLVAKIGTKVKNIRLVESDDDIDCKIDGIGGMQLKSEFVRKT